jgi:hypothetical protein
VYLKKVITPDIRISEESKMTGFSIENSSTFSDLKIALRANQPRKKNKNKTNATGACGMCSYIPKKYGRLFIRGKMRMKHNNPLRQSRKVRIKTKIRRGIKIS